MDDISQLVSNAVLAVATGTAIPAFFRWLETRTKTARAMEQSLRVAEQSLREEMRTDLARLKEETAAQHRQIQDVELRADQQGEIFRGELAAVQERERICREQIAELQRRLNAVDEYRWVWTMAEKDSKKLD